MLKSIKRILERGVLDKQKPASENSSTDLVGIALLEPFAKLPISDLLAEMYPTTNQPGIFLGDVNNLAESCRRGITTPALLAMDKLIHLVRRWEQGNASVLGFDPLYVRQTQNHEGFYSTTALLEEADLSNITTYDIQWVTAYRSQEISYSFKPFDFLGLDSTAADIAKVLTTPNESPAVHHACLLLGPTSQRISDLKNQLCIDK